MREAANVIELAQVRQRIAELCDIETVRKAIDEHVAALREQGRVFRIRLDFGAFIVADYFEKGTMYPLALWIDPHDLSGPLRAALREGRATFCITQQHDESRGSATLH